MSAININITISGTSVSGDIDTSHQPVAIELGNSDKIGQIKFSLSNKDSTYSRLLFSGNATVQADLVRNGTILTLFRGTLESNEPSVDIQTGMTANFVGYDAAQELLGLISPDARQKSLLTTSGTVSIVSGDQGMSSQQGMDLALYVSGIVGSGSTGSITSGAQLNLFMSQYYGKSGNTNGSNSGLSFSFKPYISGIAVSGANAFYKTWYVQDGASDTNANYWIPYDTLEAKHETAWEVLRKITRQGYVVDRSNNKVQFELYVDVSGGLVLRTSGTSDFVASGISLIYYLAGASGSANNNVVRMNTPFNTVGVKNFVIGWFPTWTAYPLGDDYSDVAAYSGSFWSGKTGSFSGVTLSGNTPASQSSPGMISIQGKAVSGTVNNANSDFQLIVTIFSGYLLNIERFNVSGGAGSAGVNLVYNMRVENSGAASLADGLNREVVIRGTSGDLIIKSGFGGGGNGVGAWYSGWTTFSEIIYGSGGVFNSGNGTDGGWVQSPDGAVYSGLLRNVRQLEFGIRFNTNIVATQTPQTAELWIDNIQFQFTYNFSPVIAFSSGSQFAYGRRYEIFDYPYEVTDSGAGAIVTAELQSKMLSRQIGEFVIKDNPDLPFSAQTGITPGQVFVVDAPSMATGSGQYFYYWRANEVKHTWSHAQGFVTTIMAYPWFSGILVSSGQNLISYSLPLPAPLPRTAQQMPVQWLTGQGGVRVPVPR